jgi:hypothetical protein
MDTSPPNNGKRKRKRIPKYLRERNILRTRQCNIWPERKQFLLMLGIKARIKRLLSMQAMQAMDGTTKTPQTEKLISEGQIEARFRRWETTIETPQTEKEKEKAKRDLWFNMDLAGDDQLNVYLDYAGCEDWNIGLSLVFA